MSELDLLKNEGVLALNKPRSTLPEKTVVVLGLARGGTSMVAAVLQGLGVFMGNKLGPVLEDVELSEAVESRNLAHLADMVARRNAAHSLWGWKRPSAFEHAEVWQGCFRNPYIIAVFRDPFAIANRNRISMLSDVFQNMEHSVQQLGRLVKLLRQQTGPVLLCSYEKVLDSPETFVRAVEGFLDLNAGERRADAIGQIKPASREYLQTSRITNALGYLDVADERSCSGWAFYPLQPARAARVQIFVNDQHVNTVVARLPRPDVKDKGIHPTGFCGFKFEWPVDTAPQAGDRVDARAEGDVRSLSGSPMPVGAMSAAHGQARGVAASTYDAASAGTRGALPSFYGIGAQKAGTTWLHEILKGHPQIHLPTPKELHYWDLRRDRGLQWYREHFEPGRINGDITPAYAILPGARIGEIHAVTPQAKVLFSMRHPIERAWSFVQMSVARQYKHPPADLVAGDPRGQSLAFVRNELFHPGCLQRCHYAETLRHWRRWFGDEAIMWFSYERIAEDPRGLLADICRHIGADSTWVGTLAPDVLGRIVFASEKIPFPPVLRKEFAERCAPYIDDLEQLLGERFDSWRV